MTNAVSKDRRAAHGRIGTVSLWVRVLFFGGALTLARHGSAQSTSCGVLGGASNLNYQSSAQGTQGTSVQDSRRVDVDANGLPAGLALSSASASAEFGGLHLFLDAKATADLVWQNFWGHGATASGNAGISDTLTFSLPGRPNGTEVVVAVTLGVDATVNGNHGDAFVEADLQFQSLDDPGVKIHFQLGTADARASRYTLSRQTQPPLLIPDEETAVIRLKTGTSYQLDAVLQGNVSAAADINPGTAPETHVPFSQGTVNAANTAHIGLTPITPGLVIASASKSTYPLASVGPVLYASPTVDGPYVAVTAAQVDLDTRRITTPVTGATQFYRLGGRYTRGIGSIAVKDGFVRLDY